MGQWVNRKGENRAVCGKIMMAWHGLYDSNEKFFTVEYEDHFVKLLECIPTVNNDVPEASAWGGYFAFERAFLSRQLITMLAPPFYWN